MTRFLTRLLPLLHKSPKGSVIREVVHTLFPGRLSLHRKSINPIQLTNVVTYTWSRNIHLVPIDYGSHPRLRSRLTLRGLTLRRNPWIFGEHVSHMLYRYSCQHSLFRYLQYPSRVYLLRPTECSATTLDSLVNLI